ncbi:hypothetical protein [Photobacterium gaetbulicola]|nr:hypothetical protein [Photobacterium gaetbulicola]
MYELILGIGNYMTDYWYISIPLLVFSYTPLGFDVIARLGWIFFKPIFTVIGYLLLPFTLSFIKFKTRNMTFEQKIDWYRKRCPETDQILSEELAKAEMKSIKSLIR